MAHQLELTVKTSANTEGLTKIQAGLKGMSDQALKNQIAIETASGKLDRLQTAANRTGTALGAMKAEQAARQLDQLSQQSSFLHQGLTKASAAAEKLAATTRTLITRGAEAGFLALGAAVAYSVKEAANSQKVYAQLDAVLKSTGGQAGVTAKDVTDFALAAQKVTPFTDEAVASVSNLLLTFTNIGKPIFNDATQAVLDMSTALGEDAPKAAIQLGKALQDPVLGMTALRRVGVAFDADQQQLIKTLVQTGDRLGAQKIILAELTKEFGGSAEAAGKTFAGQLAIARNSLQEVAETIGMAILPSITELSKEFTAFLQDHDEEIKAFASALARDLPDAINTTREGVIAAGQGAEVLARGLGDIAGGIDSLKVEAAALAAALAFLFPEAALAVGIAALLVSIGVLAQDTDKASESALRFRATWLNALADIAEGAQQTASALVTGALGLVFGSKGSVFTDKIPVVGKALQAAQRAPGQGIEAVAGAALGSAPNPLVDKLRAQANDATLSIKQMSQAEQDLVNQDYGTRHANDWKKADGALLGTKAAAMGLSAAQQDLAASGLDSLLVIANLTTQTGALKTGFDLVAGAAKAFTDMLNPRTLAEINLDRQIAEVEALMATYEQSGVTIPADLQKWHDALVANRDVAEKVAKAAGLNFEELAARLDAAGQDGNEVVKNLTAALEGLPEQTIVDIATQLNHGDLDEVQRVLDILKNEKVSIPIALEIEQRSRQALQDLIDGAAVGTSRLPTAYAEGGITGPGGARMAILHDNEAVLPLNNPQRTMDILHQIGVPGYDDGKGGTLVLPPTLRALLNLGTGGGNGGTTSTTSPQPSAQLGGLDGLAKLDTDLKKAGMSLTEFIAKLELMQEQEDAVAEATRVVTENQQRAAIDLTKLSIALGARGISGEAFVAQTALSKANSAIGELPDTVQSAFAKALINAKDFSDQFVQEFASIAQRAQALFEKLGGGSMGGAKKGGVVAFDTGAEGYVDEQGNRHTRAGVLTKEAYDKLPPEERERLKGKGYITNPDGTTTPLAKGMPYVPYDNFPALLHKGERVLPAADNANLATTIAKAIKEGMASNPRSGITNWGSITVKTNDPKQFARELGVVLR